MIPRFKYSYNLKDLFYSLYHLQRLKSTNLKDYFQNSNLFFTNYARTGLYLLLISLAKGKKLKVGVQAYTCHTIFQAIRKAGCDIVFLDINDEYNLDLEHLKNKISELDVVIVTHTFGIPADMKNIMKTAKGKVIIEDCAHALFTKFDNQQVGLFGDAAIFSIGYGKYPSIGPGGITIINNEKLVNDFSSNNGSLEKPTTAEEIKNICKNFLYATAFNKFIYGLVTYPLGKRLDEKFDFIGKHDFKVRSAFLSNINLFNMKLHQYKDLNMKQVGVGVSFAKRLQNDYKLDWAFKQNPNFYFFPLRSNRRNDIVGKLFKAGYESGKHFAKSIEWAINYGYEVGECPNTEKIINEIFTIPTKTSFKTKHINKISTILGNLK